MVYANRGRNDTRGRPGGVDSRYQKRTLFAVGELSIQSVYASVSSVGAMVVRSDELGRRRGAVGGRARRRCIAYRRSGAGALTVGGGMGCEKDDWI